jgi:tetratricopeptide (TPR) repeat protein
MAVYDAFISYSHAKDKPTAAALQSVVQTLGKPWYRRRALRIFRDDTSLSATPELWPAIEQALARSRFLILLASPESAASPWVNREVAYWLEHKGAGTLLLAVTAGELAWDDAAADFDRRRDTPLPPALAGRFAVEPKWVDLRSYRDGATPNDTRFIELGADFAAAIHGMPKEDLLSQEVRQQRRALMLAWSAVGSLLVLAGAAAWQWQAAVAQRDRAEAALARAETLIASASKSTLVVGDMFDSGLLPTTVAQQILDVLRGTFTELAREQIDRSITPAQLRLLDVLSRSHLAVGHIQEALDVAQTARRLATQLVALDRTNNEWQKLLADAHTRLGSALRRQGKVVEALAQFQASRTITAQLCLADPDNRKWQHDLAFILETISDTLKAQGDLDGAFAENNASLAIYAKLGSKWDVANSLLRFGDIYWDRGDLDRALEHFREASGINAGPAEEMTSTIEPERNWKWSAAVSYLRVGNALRVKGHLDEALVAYRNYMRVVVQLEFRDPRNEVWQRHKARSHAMTGDVLFAKGDLDGALKEYENVRAGARLLLERDGGNRFAQQELSESHRRFGDVWLARGEHQRAIEHFDIAIKIAGELVAADRSNVFWQEDLAVDRERKGDALRADGQLTAAFEEYQAAIALIARLLDGQPLTRESWRHNLARGHGRIGSVLAAQKRFDEARLAFRDCLAVNLTTVSFDLRNSTPRNAHEECRRGLERIE